MARPYLPKELMAAGVAGMPALWMRVDAGREFECESCHQRKTGPRYVKTEASAAWRGTGTKCPDCHNKSTAPSQPQEARKEPVRHTLPG